MLPNQIISNSNSIYFISQLLVQPGSDRKRYTPKKKKTTKLESSQEPADLKFDKLCNDESNDSEFHTIGANNVVIIVYLRNYVEFAARLEESGNSDAGALHGTMLNAQVLIDL